MRVTAKRTHSRPLGRRFLTWHAGRANRERGSQPGPETRRERGAPAEPDSGDRARNESDAAPGRAARRRAGGLPRWEIPRPEPGGRRPIGLPGRRPDYSRHPTDHRTETNPSHAPRQPTDCLRGRSQRSPPPPPRDGTSHTTSNGPPRSPLLRTRRAPRGKPLDPTAAERRQGHTPGPHRRRATPGAHPWTPPPLRDARGTPLDPTAATRRQGASPLDPRRTPVRSLRSLPVVSQGEVSHGRYAPALTPFG
jgi:hypothetical protein